MHVADGNRAVEILTCSAVTQTYLSISGNRYTLPYLSVLSIVRQILHYLRKKFFSVKAFKGFALPLSAVSSCGKTIFLPVCCFRCIEGQIYIIICQIQSIHNVVLVCTAEYRSCHIKAKCLCSKGKVNLQYLSNVHTGRHTQRIQYNIQRTSVGQIRHIFHRKYTGNDTLVSVTASHLVTYGNLSLLRNINTNRHIYSGRKFITVLSCKYLGVYNNTILTMRYL